MPKRKEPAEFDFVLLGAIFRGYTTGYSIRKLILRTRGQRWSGSTGAVYPALRRLHSAGYLVVADDAENGKRASTSYHISDEGRAALRSWLMDRPGEEDMGLISDPLRSRCLNLSLLNAAERRKAVAQWKQAHQEYVTYFQKARQALPKSTDTFVRLGFENMKEMLEGRTRWLEHLASEVGLKE